MSKLFWLLALGVSALSALADSAPVAIAIHGGAGTLSPEKMDAATRARHVAALNRALSTGHRTLKSGGTAIEAVVLTVSELEDSPLFNAGVGAVYTWDGHHELDASLMDGATLRAGAVTGVRTVANPIRLAHAVMMHSRHVLLSGRGAEAFASSRGFATVPNSHFNTPRRLESLERMKRRADTAQSNSLSPYKWGTVGAVALDRDGNLAAATSTGGMTGKRWGRIGDSPIIGAGTYADNRSCAVSATGHGEYFIRYNVAAEICARVRLAGQSIDEASHGVLFDDLLPAGGTGGVIVMDPQGQIAMPFNTQGMYRGSIDTRGVLSIEIFKQPEPARAADAD